jgi:effector-binding domain-containing protein
MMIFMDMDAMLGADFEKSLAGLKKHTESLGSPEMVAIQIEATTMPPMKIMIINDSADLTNIGEKLGGAYGEIQGEMGKQGLTATGAPFAIYNKVDMNRPDGGMYFWMDIGMPVDKAGKSNGRITYKEVPGGNVVKGMHYGSYEATGESHEQMDKWMKDNGKTVTGGPWEFYVTDPGTEPDTSKWLTEIYYPVQ